MKRLGFALLVLAAFAFGSCKECTTCQIKAGSVYESVPEEKCGSASEVDDFEDDYSQQAQLLGITGARAYCVRK